MGNDAKWHNLKSGVVMSAIKKKEIIASDTK